MNEFNKNLIEASNKSQIKALKRIDKRYGTNYVHKWEEIDI